jgi:hypothetical protein
MGGKCSTHGTREINTIFWLGNLKERDQSDVDGKTILALI